MCAPRTAFVPAVPLLHASPRRRAPARTDPARTDPARTTHHARPVCAANTPNPPRPARFPTALIAAAGALLGAFSPAPSAAQLRHAGFDPLSSQSAADAVTRVVPAARAAPATQSPSPSTTTKDLRYDGRQELDSGEKALSMTITLGAFATLAVWAWKQNRRDDELETVRIKEEVERLEKLRAEFVDVEEDDDSLNDDDLLASLKQRISEGDDADADSDDPADPVAPEQAAAQGEDPANAPGSTAVDTNSPTADRRDPANGPVGSDAPSDPEPTSPQAGNPDSVDMLRRMWDATDDDPKKDKS